MAFLFCILLEWGALSLNIFIKGPDVRVPVPWRACRCSGPIRVATTPAVIIAPSGAVWRLAWQRVNPECGQHVVVTVLSFYFYSAILAKLLSALNGHNISSEHLF